MIELKLISEFPQEIIAVDEVGRSPLSGPVVIGGVRLSIQTEQELGTLLRSLRRNKVKDSKALTSVQRGEILEKLKISHLPYREKSSFTWKGIVISFVTWEMDPEVIDRENILQASLRGMKEVAEFLSEKDKSQTTVLIDGHLKLRWESPPHPWKEISIIQGDTKSPLIGLAAIIAKEKRDAWMRQMHELYPHYSFDTNFGYPTRAHRQAIEKHGPCLIHRKSFNKVKEFLPSE